MLKKIIIFLAVILICSPCEAMRLSLRKFPIYNVAEDSGVENYSVYPTSAQTTDSVTDYWGGAAGISPYKMLPDVISVSVVSDVASVTPAVGYVSHLTFCTPPLYAQDIAAGNWTMQMYEMLTRQDPSGNDPSVRMRVYSYIWKADNTKGSEIFSPASDGTDYVLSSYTAMNHTVAGNAVSVADGDMICFEFYHDVQNLNGGSSTKLGFTQRWNGTAIGSALSYVDTPVDLKFKSRVLAPTVFKVPDTFAVPDKIVPAVENGTYTYSLTSTTGYTVSNVSVDDTVAKGFVLTPNAMDTNEEFEDSDFTSSPAWADYSSLTQSTSILKFGVGTGLAASSNADTSRLVLANVFAVGGSIYDSVWFKLNSSSGYTGDTWVIWTSNTAGSTIVAGWGVNTSISSNTFSYWDNTSTNWVDTGVTLDTNGHTIAFTSEDLGGTMTFTVDGTTYGGVMNSFNTRAFVVRTSQSGKTISLDRKFHNDEGFYSTGTFVTPKLQPSAVSQWTSFSKSDATTQGYRGTIVYEFQWSLDSGSTWNGTWTALTDANLLAVGCNGDGTDAIKIQGTLTPYLALYTPRSDSITLNYNAPFVVRKVEY